jgi:tetratricopeptide (TPR) repeat protein
MASADDAFELQPPARQRSEERLEALAQQSQLDFDIAFFRRILQREPDYLDVLRCQGELLSRKGLHAQALEVDRRLVRLLPDDCVVQYNLACSLAVGGLRDDAIAALRAAFLHGYDDFDHMECDSDLDGLRDDPAYRDLLREYGIMT